MKASFNWFREFVELPADPEAIKAVLTRVGIGVDSFAAAGDDWVFEIEVTTNRPDCLNHYGLARELATALHVPLKRIEVTPKETGPATGSEIQIEIAAPDLCARYCGRVVQNVRVGSSPDWLVRRLAVCGLRSINNVADATNYVLLELGHPLHAFDLSRVARRHIVVRRAYQDEGLRTLDGIDRKLNSDHLVIADGERAVALAGIMGGEESQIIPATRSVLIESAWFEPISVRRTSKTLGMHTEASHRFERGADIEMAPLALDRTVTLIQSLAGGEILRGMVDVYPRTLRRESIMLRRSEIFRILGAEILWEEVERALRQLGFQPERRGTEGWKVTPPSFRLDISREVDLIEEAARHFGYDRLPARLAPAPPRLDHDVQRERRLALEDVLIGLGYREIISSSMVDPEETASFSPNPPLVLENPLSQEASALRTSPVPSLLQIVRRNLDHGMEDLRLFEFGKVYLRNGKGLPEERGVLSLGLCGIRREANIHEGAVELDFFDLKGDLESVLGLFALEDLRFAPNADAYYETSLRGSFWAGQQRLAQFGQLGRNVLQRYKLRRALLVAELDLEAILAKPLRNRTFRSYSKFPAVQRDFSLTVPDGVNYERIEHIVRAAGIASLTRLQPMDYFQSAGENEGFYSLLVRATFQSHEATLTSEAIQKECDTLLGALKPLGVRLRGDGARS